MALTIVEKTESSISRGTASSSPWAILPVGADQVNGLWVCVVVHRWDDGPAEIVNDTTGLSWTFRVWSGMGGGVGSTTDPGVTILTAYGATNGGGFDIRRYNGGSFSGAGYWLGKVVNAHPTSGVAATFGAVYDGPEIGTWVHTLASTPGPGTLLIAGGMTYKASPTSGVYPTSAELTTLYGGIAVGTGGRAHIGHRNSNSDDTIEWTSADTNPKWASAAIEIAEGSAAPQIFSITPDNGSTAGGNTVVITGAYFTGVTSVTFGGTAASFTVDSDSQITATVPARAAGQVAVVITR